MLASQSRPKVNKRFDWNPACFDDKLLQPMYEKFLRGTTTLKTALTASETEYLRQSRPTNPEEEFMKLRSGILLGLTGSCCQTSPVQLPLNKSSASYNVTARSQSIARDLTDFVEKFPLESSELPASICSATSARQDQHCQHCQRKGHNKGLLQTPDVLRTACREISPI